jgi:glycosyltransferase involved in cell wall biosynthesis
MTAPGHSPRVGVVVSHVIQYFSPLFDLLSARGVVNPIVGYGNDAGSREQLDADFGVEYSWDLDLLGGHAHRFMTEGASPSLREKLAGFRNLAAFVRSCDIVVIHGYATPVTAAAVLFCYFLRVPYLFRTDASQRPAHRRASVRHWWPRWAARRSAGALVVGSRNSQVMAELGCPELFKAPFAVDDRRFRAEAEQVRTQRDVVRRSYGLPERGLVVAFAGKFVPLKRASDLVQAMRGLTRPAHLLMIGDGPQRGALEDQAAGLPVTFTGFLNQLEMPRALACADILVLPSDHEQWGLIVNEAMACGCVPVTSDAVGCAPDLVDGAGLVFETGNVVALTDCIEQALDIVGSKATHARLAGTLECYTLIACAEGYERAVQTVLDRHREQPS